MTNNKVSLTQGGQFTYESISLLTYMGHMKACDWLRDMAGLDGRSEDWQAECIDCGADIPEDTDNGMCNSCLTDHIIRMAQINWVADCE